jgi:hypothetical protein
MSKKGESFRGYIMEILSHDKNIKTCWMQLITSKVIFNSALVSDKWLIQFTSVLRIVVSEESGNVPWFGFYNLCNRNFSEV